jgi:hypothetical protein
MVTVRVAKLAQVLMSNVAQEGLVALLLMLMGLGRNGLAILYTVAASPTDPIHLVLIVVEPQKHPFPQHPPFHPTLRATRMSL